MVEFVPCLYAAEVQGSTACDTLTRVQFLSLLLQLADVLASAKTAQESHERMRVKAQAADAQHEAAIVCESQLRSELATTQLKLESIEAECDTYRTQV